MPELNGRFYTRVETCVPCGNPLGIDETPAAGETIANGYRCEGCGKLMCFRCDPQAEPVNYLCASCVA